MTSLDWSIVAVLFGGLIVLVLYLTRLNRSVADYLAANRAAGRYLLTVSQAASSFGAISTVAIFEKHYQAGFAPMFWSLILIPIGFIIAASGWVIYRYRETRVFTLAQFFELRYSRNFRVFMGGMAFFSGILNYGIFPAVTANFFQYFCGLPQEFLVLGVSVNTITFLMAAQLTLAITITLGGGQISVLIADFVQGQFINIVMLLTLFWLASIVRWDQVVAVLSQAPENASLVNPFKTSQVKDFNFWFYAIAAVGAFYGTLAWQGSQGFNACAKNPHEARMGAILGMWRSSLTGFLPPLAGVCAWVFMHHPEFFRVAESVNAELGAIANAQVQYQMTVPLALRFVLPIGLMGLFTTMMISAAVSTDTSYLHSWGSIFVQDVLMPLRKRPLSPEAHIRALRLAVVGVALFAFCFSLFFKQTEHILLFMAATGAIFIGGAGSVIIGGLYWRKGTTAAAWASMVTGSSVAGLGIIAKQFDRDFLFNGQQMYFFAMVSAVLVYVTISLLQNRSFDIDRILHRGKYRDLLPPEERQKNPPQTGFAALGPGPDFTRKDRLVLWITLGMQASFFLSAVLISVVYLFFRFSDSVWFTIWFTLILIWIAKAIIAFIWLLIGGTKDLKEAIIYLRSAKRNQLDDGTVISGHNRGE
jgi:SSS family solute:Na+ symporter